MQTKTKITIYLILATAISTFISLFIILQQTNQSNNATASITKSLETQINPSNSAQQQRSKTAIDKNENTITVWLADDSGINRTYYTKIDKSGTVITSPQVVDSTTTNAQSNPDIAIDKEGNFFIVWQENGGGIFFKAYKNDGTQIGSTTQIKSAGQNPSISATYDQINTDTTRIAISFTYTNTDDDILFRTYDINTGTTPSITYLSETTVPGTLTGTQKSSDIAINKFGDIIVSWTDLNSNDIKYKIYKSDGTTLQTDTTANTYAISTTATSAVATDKQLNNIEFGEKKFIITYDANINASGDNGIATKVITCTTTCSESPEIITNDLTTPTEDSANPDVSADFLGNFTVVWETPTYDGSQTLTDKDIEGQSYNNEGKKIGQNFQVNTTNTTNYQTYPSISMNDEGQYNIAFTDNTTNIYTKRYNTEINKIETETLENSSTTGTQSEADTSISRDGYTATVWKDDNDNSIKFTLRNASRTIIVQDQVVYTDATADNPKIAFYFDTNNFVITWQAQGSSDTDIYYRTYNSSGTATNTATVLNTPTTNDQTHPVIAASYEPKFVVGWLDSSNKIDSAYYDGTTFHQTTIETCSASDPCTDLNIAIKAGYEYVVLTWIQDTTTKQAYAKEAYYDWTSYSAIGSKFLIANTNYKPSVAFTKQTQFLIAYDSAKAQRYNFSTSTNPTSSVDGEITVSPAPPSTQINIATSYDYGHYILNWEENNQIKGVIFKYIDTTTKPTQYGPVFTINSTPSSNQIMPTIDSNSKGRIIVAWEGNTNQPLESPTQTDTYGIETQLLQNPLIQDENDKLNPSITQEITTGNFTLQAPSTINFQTAEVSVTTDQTKTISIRHTNDGTCGTTCGPTQDQNCPCGGDPIKYLEITDERGGQEFNLTVSATNFTSEEDHKTYITNSALKIRNWDQDTTNITNTNCSTANPSTCFTTVSTSLEDDKTTMTLSNDTENFVSLDQVRTLATKPATSAENPKEIGKWRIYPEFQLTIPPIIPTGNHTATITFTLN